MEKTIIDFSSADEQDRWEIINDAVMGGVSSGRVSITETKSALFQGEVSLENYGGFASMRTHPREFGLAGCSGLILRVKGDGKNYRLRLRMDDAWEGIAYQAYFSTEQDTWITARLSFDAFIPVFRGRVIKDASELDVSRIRRIGFMIADRQAGPFRLEIKWVRAYS
jgi:NADH dehydrogenase [ubiquinone] 1 alpha subcomplex assembly factor 1